MKKTSAFFLVSGWNIPEFLVRRLHVIDGPKYENHKVVGVVPHYRYANIPRSEESFEGSSSTLGGNILDLEI